MRIFVPKEVVPGETRVAANPDSVKRMVKSGFEVTVESGAGLGSSISDAEYEAVGAKIEADLATAYAAADLVLKFHPPREHPGASRHEVDMMREGATLISFLYGQSDPDLVRRLVERKIDAFGMELIPRISRAQKMDALSSQSNIAGYKSVIMAAEHLGKLFPLLMTAAGTITPAKVVILGAGVAGLQAIATAKRLGALVEVSDIRPAVKEQVESLGGRFIEVKSDAEAEDAGGYAKEASEDYKRRQQEALEQRLREADVVITTALIPGRPAPRLISAAMVEMMPSGSVLVDLAADQGGNCELTKPGEIVREHDVTIVGTQNVPSLVPVHATDMYAKNVQHLLLHLTKEGEWNLDPEDEITSGSALTKGGEIVHEPTAEALKAGSDQG